MTDQPLPPDATENSAPPMSRAGTDEAPPPLPPTSRSPLAATLAIFAWVVIVAVAVGHKAVSLAAAESEEMAEVGESIDAIVNGIQGRYLVGAAKMTGSGAQLFAQSQEMLDIGSITQRARFIVLAGEMAGDVAAIEQLDALEELIGREGVEPTPQEAALLRILRTAHTDGPDAVGEEDRALLVDALDWHGRLALAPDDPDDPQRKAVIEPATVSFGYIIGAVVLAGIALFVGFVALVATFAFVLTGSVRLRFEDSETPSGIYAETFALWLVIFIGGQVLAGVIAARLEPGFDLWITLVMFFLSLVALGWPRLRGVPWSRVRSDVGLTNPKGVVEPAVGVLGYAMALTFLGVGLVITLVLMAGSGMMAEPAKPLEPVSGPAHPIVSRLADGDFLALLPLFLLGSVAAPIVEETMFRGVLYRHLRGATKGLYGGLQGAPRGLGRFLSILVSCVVSSFVFAFVHPQEWVAIPALMGLATAFCLLREWRGSLVAPMVVHGISNGVVLGSVAFLASQG